MYSFLPVNAPFLQGLACIKNEKSVFFSMDLFSLVHLLQIMTTSEIKDQETLAKATRNRTNVFLACLFLRHWLETHSVIFFRKKLCSLCSDVISHSTSYVTYDVIRHLGQDTYLRSEWLFLFAPMPVEERLRFPHLHPRQEVLDSLLGHLLLTPNTKKNNSQSFILLQREAHPNGNR